MRRLKASQLVDPLVLRRLLEELKRRELLKKAAASRFVIEDVFKKQNDFINDPSRFLVAQCSRRAGKTNALAIRFFKTLASHPKSTCIYLALTRESAYEIMWPVLQEINDKYQLGCTFTESKLVMENPEGARLRLIGADMKNFVKRLKGIKSPGIAIDEAQDFGAHLQSLVDDVLTPTMTDYKDSWLALTGTPGPVPQGYFYEVTKENKYGYSKHEWTLLENPYLPNAEEFLNELIKKREWEHNNPTLLREWRNQWVLDVQSLWIRYYEHCHFDDLPAGNFEYVMGVDLGFNDSDAVVILAYTHNSPHTYLIDEVITPKQGLTELVNQIQKLRIKYKVNKIVVDEGGLGKKLAEEMRRRHQIPAMPVEKSRKQETVEFLNDALRLGHLKIKKSSRFVHDANQIQIDWEKSTADKIVIKKNHHSDIIDAVIYAFKESPAYTYRAPIQKPKYGSKEWALDQEREMYEKALEHFKKADKDALTRDEMDI